MAIRTVAIQCKTCKKIGPVKLTDESYQSTVEVMKANGTYDYKDPELKKTLLQGECWECVTERTGRSGR